MNTRDKPTKFVVLGVAHPHVFALAQAAAEEVGLELAALYEPDPNHRAKAEQTLDCVATDDLDAALSTGPSLALIGAVPAQRAALASRATAAGAAVLVDKPLALTDDALDPLIHAQRQNNRPVIVYFPYRGDPHVVAAKDLLDRGAIGELVRVYAAGPHKLNAAARPDWHWTRAGNGGALVDIGSHHIDMCCYMADAAPTSVRATHANRTQPDHPEFQDYALAQLAFNNHTTGVVEVDWLNPESMNHFGDTRFWLLGTRGKIEIRLGDVVEARLHTHDTPDQPIDTSGHLSRERWTALLIDDLAHGRPPAIPQEDVWRACRVSLRAFDSARRNGDPVTV